MTSVVWFRRDLRVHDHPALTAATERGDVACLFVLDDRLLEGRSASGNRNWFLAESLRELAASIEARGGMLVVRRGRPEAVVPELARQFGASAVHVSRDYGPFSRRRDAAVAAELALAGIELVESPGVLAVEPEAVLKRDGGAYGVFGPFYRRWTDVAPRQTLPAPESLRAPDGVPKSELGSWRPPRPNAALIEPGESAARKRLATWAGGGLRTYESTRNLLDIAGTSRLSQDLRWGLLSVNEVREQLAGEGESFERELAWRDFYHHLAWHQPRVLREPFRREAKALPWNKDGAALAAWQRGETGYPVVDAAMRQLVETGWMHNRARMIVASFLTKNLLIDYREGERFFMRHLVDGDPAVNNGGWQWASSTGTDAQPYFRVFNPVLQGNRFDPDGVFVRRWLPVLAKVPDRWVHEPWAMPAEAQKTAACVIGRDYPAPIVALEGAAARARAFFESGRGARG
jgi:deoxyribodipyrimidine photo-lyase